MSSPSTPRTTRFASPTAGSPEILTPGRKIKAMMAALDSDSESDNDNTQQQRPKPRLSDILKKSSVLQPQEMMVDSDNTDDEEDIVMPKGRMAARMQGHAQNNGTNAGETAFDRVSKILRIDKDDGQTDTSRVDSATDQVVSSGDEDDLPTAGPRRRIARAEKTPEPGRSPSRARSFSPLFMSSPTAQRNDAQEQDAAEGSGNEDEDEDLKLKTDPRIRALVIRKRKERKEKERIEAEKKAAQAAQREQFSSEIALDEESADDGGSGRKLTQQSRPARKASKKALEEMHRETQRMSRNMQLAHQAQTKKRITKESFFARFNFMQPEEPSVSGSAPENSSTTAGSQNSSDNEAHKDKETPHTSPVLGPSDKASTGKVTNESVKEAEVSLDDLPTLEDLLAKPRPQPEQPIIGRMEEHAQNPSPESAVPKKERKVLTGPPVRVLLPRQVVAQHQKEDSDDDLEVVTSPAKCRRIAAFENLPAKKLQESSSILKLKMLAQLTSPTRQKSKYSNIAELSANLLHQARQQAAKERQERIQELRDKGVIVETAEDRAKMEDEIENLMEKARQEGEEIAKKEREAAKRKKGGDEDDFELSGSDEESYIGSEEDEEGEEENEEEEEHDNVDDQGLRLIDSEASEDDESEDDRTDVMSSEETDVPVSRRKRLNRVIGDDEDEDQEPKTPIKPINSTVHSVERPQFPGLRSDGLTMSLTQAFAGTLGGSPQDSQQNSTAVLNSLPDPAEMNHKHQESDSQIMVKDSQEQRRETPDLLGGYAPSVPRVSESPAPRTMSQFSQIPDPTQDAGFVLSPFDPSKRFMGTPQSTIETVILGQQELNNSPIPERKMNHLRRGRAANLSIIEEQEEGDFEINASAFNVMKKAAKTKKPDIPFDRKKSKAKEIIDEAAEESDDEYAGLGGASDDSEDEEDAYDAQMINDNSGETVDEKQLAALNALHQRNADEKQVAKLLKDITTGALRRRRNPDDDFDLDDSDDELLARRRQKQREFARMRKALLADEKIGEIAENPKKAAFFRAIEDRDMDDDVGLDFLDDEKESGSQEDSSSQYVGSEAQQPTTEESNKRKRPLEPSAEDVNNRPPPHLRRTAARAISKKPATLAEIRETLSFLTEGHEYDSFHEVASIDEDDGDERNDSDSNIAEEQPSEEALPARTHPRRTRGPVVDRLALLRQASSNSANSASSGTRMAFHSGSGNDIGFRPPPLIRKTSSSITTSSKSDSSRRVAKTPAGGSLTKKGAVNYYTAAREREREREIRASHRSSGSNITALLNKHAGNRLGALGGKSQWE